MEPCLSLVMEAILSAGQSPEFSSYVRYKNLIMRSIFWCVCRHKDGILRSQLSPIASNRLLCLKLLDELSQWNVRVY